MNKKIIIVIIIFLVIVMCLALIKKNNIYSKNNANYARLDASSSYDYGIILLENGVEIANVSYSSVSGSVVPVNGVLFNEFVGEGEEFKIGKHYEEKLKVKNSGSKDIYVRAVVNKSWNSWNGEEENLDTKLIELNFIETNWIIDDSLSTDDRIVLYYKNLIHAGETTTEFSNVFSLNEKVLDDKIFIEDDTGNGKFITSYRKYDGANFIVEVNVDAVGTDNARNDIKSAWGINVNIDSNGRLSL